MNNTAPAASPPPDRFALPIKLRHVQKQVHRFSPRSLPEHNAPKDEVKFFLYQLLTVDTHQIAKRWPQWVLETCAAWGQREQGTGADLRALSVFELRSLCPLDSKHAKIENPKKDTISASPSPECRETIGECIASEVKSLKQREHRTIATWDECKNMPSLKGMEPASSVRNGGYGMSRSATNVNEISSLPKIMRTKNGTDSAKARFPRGYILSQRSPNLDITSDHTELSGKLVPSADMTTQARFRMGMKSTPNLRSGPDLRRAKHHTSKGIHNTHACCSTHEHSLSTDGGTPSLPNRQAIPRSSTQAVDSESKAMASVETVTNSLHHRSSRTSLRSSAHTTPSPPSSVKVPWPRSPRSRTLEQHYANDTRPHTEDHLNIPCSPIKNAPTQQFPQLKYRSSMPSARIIHLSHGHEQHTMFNVSQTQAKDRPVASIMHHNLHRSPSQGSLTDHASIPKELALNGGSSNPSRVGNHHRKRSSLQSNDAFPNGTRLASVPEFEMGQTGAIQQGYYSHSNDSLDFQRAASPRPSLPPSKIRPQSRHHRPACFPNAPHIPSNIKPQSHEQKRIPANNNYNTSLAAAANDLQESGSGGDKTLRRYLHRSTANFRNSDGAAHPLQPLSHNRLRRIRSFTPSQTTEIPCPTLIEIVKERDFRSNRQ